MIPEDIREFLTDGECWWIDSIRGYGYVDGDCFRSLGGKAISLTDDDISAIGSCLGL